MATFEVIVSQIVLANYTSYKQQHRESELSTSRPLMKKKHMPCLLLCLGLLAHDIHLQRNTDGLLLCFNHHHQLCHVPT